MADPLPPLDDSRDRNSDSNDDSSSSYDSGASRGTRGVGGGRHFASVLFAFLLVPAGYVLLDYSTFRAIESTAQLDESLPSRVLMAFGIAACCLLLAAATARISALGPLLAGLLWGIGPAAWMLLDYSAYVEAVRDIPDPYDSFGLALLTTGWGLFPAVAGLLLGAAVAGRWRRARADL